MYKSAGTIHFIIYFSRLAIFIFAIFFIRFLYLEKREILAME